MNKPRKKILFFNYKGKSSKSKIENELQTPPSKKTNTFFSNSDK